MFSIKKTFLIALALSLASVLGAQTTPPPSTSTGFSASTDAVAIYFNNEWTPGAHITQSFDLMDFGTSKANHLSIQANQMLAPTPGLNIYTGGFELQPNLGSLFSRTNIPNNTLQLFFNGSAGVGTISSGPNQVSFLAGGGVRYNFNSSVTWNSLQVTYVRFGSINSVAISSGLSYIFGPKASATQVSSTTAAKK